MMQQDGEQGRRQHQQQQQQRRRTPLEKTYLSALKAKVQKGESIARFTVRLPRVGGLDRLNSSMEATVLSVTAVEEPSPVVYGLELSVKRPNHVFSFGLQNPFGVGVQLVALARRLRDHFANARKQFSTSVNVPLGYLDVSDPNGSRFILSVPPKTAIFSTWNGFWEMLGFSGHEKREDVAMVTRGASATFVAYGFWNTGAETLDLTGDVMYANVAFADLLEGMLLEAPATVQVQLQVEAEVSSTVVAPSAYPPDLSNASRVLGLLLQEACEECNLATNTFTVVDEGTVLSVTNAAVANSRTTYEINLDKNTNPVFDGDEQLSFEARAATEYEMKVTKTEIADAFSEKYPVTMLLQGCGQASHWIDGRGYCAVLGTCHEKPKTVTSRVVLFETDMIGMQLECIDGNFETIAFKENCTITILLNLTPVSNN